jgi:sec-independent protein translocase protein TatB
MGVPPQIQLSTIGMWDSMFLMLLALVVFGPRRLPQIGRQIGKLMYEFRKASNDFKFQMEEELRVAEDADRRKKEEDERARNLALSAPAPPAVGPTSPYAGEPPALGPTSPYTGEPPALGQASPYAGEVVNVQEQASVSAPPPQEEAASQDPSEGTSSPTAESAAAETGNRIYPRISPPSTGETVAASRYGANGRAAEPVSETAAVQEVATEGGVAAEANIGAEPAPSAEPPAAGSSSEPDRTETVGQHG